MLKILWDLGSWSTAVPISLILRFDFNPPVHLFNLSLFIGLFLGILHLIIGVNFSLYQGRYRIGSFDEVAGILVIVFSIGFFATILNLNTAILGLPKSITILSTILTIISVLGGRFFWRILKRYLALKGNGDKTLIYGAGNAGLQIVQLILSDPRKTYKPVGFIDDSLNKINFRSSGLKVLGTSEDLGKICQQRKIKILLIAIAKIDSNKLLEIYKLLSPIDVKIRIIPSLFDITDGLVNLSDISEIKEEDLMGRKQIETDTNSIKHFCKDKKILVTGAGGSIGSELTRQIAKYSPQKLFLLDRDESALLSTQLSLNSSGDLMDSNIILADIRDAKRIDEIICESKPDIVFHAAALKHLTLLERYPEEAFKTNITGTSNLLAAALKSNVKNFINISTDKAADPSSILGKSKLITEQLTAGVPREENRSFVSVRFGNVLGSRGSVIDTFRHQIKSGGPVTVTSDSVTRFFMTIQESVHLVLQAAVIGEPGNTLILEMGAPVKIVDLANLMIQRSGKEVQIVYTGLRPGEKLNEVLISSSEIVIPTSHKSIMSTRVDPIDLPGPTSLNELNW
jgi:FlaA1/EpsC-like NDP-sugar epimerase